MYPKVLPIIRDTIYFRYRLIPYLYNLMVEAADQGHPILRPLVYQFPDDPNCVEESFDFMLGPSLLVASVLKAGVNQREVYLPQGQSWYDFYTGQRYAGGKSHLVPAPLERIPLFVPEGGMLPMGEVVHPLIHPQDDLRQVYLFPFIEQGSSRLELSEDDGISLGYQQGQTTRVNIDLQCTDKNIQVVVRLNPYGYPLSYTQIEFILPAGENRKVVLQRLSCEWLDEEQRRHYCYMIPEFKG